MQINEKEYAIIREISNNHLPDQRKLAQNAGISLGLTNMIIKRLVNKGYVKVKQLNQKKIQYILTPKGFTEKARKSYDYIVKTVNVFKNIREYVVSLIREQINKGYRNFVVCGRGDIAELAVDILLGLSSQGIKYEVKNSTSPVTFESYRDEKQSGRTSTDIIKYLSEKGQFVPKTVARRIRPPLGKAYARCRPQKPQNRSSFETVTLV